MDLYDQSRTLVYSSPVMRRIRSEAGFQEWHDLVACLLDNYRECFSMSYLPPLKFLPVLLANEEKNPKTLGVRRDLVSRVSWEPPVTESIPHCHLANAPILSATWKFYRSSRHAQRKKRRRISRFPTFTDGARLSFHYLSCVKSFCPSVYPVCCIGGATTEVEVYIIQCNRRPPCQRGI